MIVEKSASQRNPKKSVAALRSSARVAQKRRGLDYTVWNEIFQGVPSKGQRTQVRIAEAAVRLYAKQGVHATTYDDIARETEVSRPLVIKYFPTYEDLFGFVAHYLRAKFQIIAVNRIKKASSPEGQLANYIDAMFEAVEKFPKDSRVWLYFYYQCALDKNYKRINTEMVEIGHRRIQIMIEEGVKQGVFHTASPVMTARAIQVQITGTLVSYLSEDRVKELPELAALLHQACFQLAGRRPTGH